MKKNSGTQDPKKEDKSRTSRFFKKLDFSEISELEANDEHKPKEEYDPHSFPLFSDIFGSKRVERVRSKKDRILFWLGIVIGFLFIVFGAILMMGSPDRVADNVMFGEKEVFSVFLILIGALIIACSVAFKFLGKTFFKEAAEDDASSNGTSSSKNKKG